MSSTLTRDEGSLLCERVGSVATMAGERISNGERQVRRKKGDGTCTTMGASNPVASLTNARLLISH